MSEFDGKYIPVDTTVLKGHAGSIIFFIVVLFFIYLQNTGKLQQIRSLLQSLGDNVKNNPPDNGGGNSGVPMTDKVTRDKVQKVIDTYAIGQAPANLAEYLIRVSKETGIALDLMLAQGALESNFGTKGRGARTHNIYNVGNVDSGANKEMGDWLAGIYNYARLMVKSYRKTFEENAARDFTNNAGHRYATDPNYTKKLTNLVRQIRGILNG